MALILTVDIGNSRAKFGIFETGQACCPQVQAITAVRLDQTQSIADSLSLWLDQLEVSALRQGLVAASNPPKRDELLGRWQDLQIPVRIIQSCEDIPLGMDVEEPHSVGIDRLLTALAGLRLFGNRQPLIVVDSGTATTINLTTTDAVFRGGAILPGLRLSAHAMHDYTARLPRIDTDSLTDSKGTAHAPLPGRNTTDAMRSGLFWGQLGAIREISEQLANAARQRFAETSKPLHLLTGGGGRQLARYLDQSVYVDSLALHGLACLADTCGPEG
ncbi:MAG: type III pantothenate kinase [Planctomycetaceae bacterium]